MVIFFPYNVQLKNFYKRGIVHVRKNDISYYINDLGTLLFMVFGQFRVKKTGNTQPKKEHPQFKDAAFAN